MSSNSRNASEHTNKKPRIDRDSFDTMVAIKVSSHKMVFTMHKRIICNVSPFFKTAFEGSFAEAQKQVLELPSESITVFKHFQLWVYTDNVIAKGETVKDVTATSLAGLYIFGNVYDIPDLQNKAIDVLIDKYQASKQFPIDILHKVYDDTPDTAPLRRLLVDLMACKATFLPSWFIGPLRQHFPKDFLFDLAVVLYALRVGSRVVITDFQACRSDYHVKPPPGSPPTSARGTAASK